MFQARYLSLLLISTAFAVVVAMVACAPQNRDSRTNVSRGGNNGRPSGEQNPTATPLHSAPIGDLRGEDDYVHDDAVSDPNLAVAISTQAQLEEPATKALIDQGVSFTRAHTEARMFTDGVAADGELNNALRDLAPENAEQRARNAALAAEVVGGSVRILRGEGNTRTARVRLMIKSGTQTANFDQSGAITSGELANLEQDINGRKVIVNLRCVPVTTCDTAIVDVLREESAGVQSQARAIRRLLHVGFDVVRANATAGGPGDAASERLRNAFSGSGNNADSGRLVRRIRVESFTVPYGISRLSVTFFERIQRQGTTAGADPVVSSRVVLSGILVRRQANDTDAAPAFSIVRLPETSSDGLRGLIQEASLVANDGRGAFTIELRSNSGVNPVQLRSRNLTDAERAEIGRARNSSGRAEGATGGAAAAEGTGAGGRQQRGRSAPAR